MTDRRLRIAVVGHVEHVSIGRVTRLPQAGDIAHLDEIRWFPGGGGGVAFAQLATAHDCELHLFTAIGNDDAGRQVLDGLAKGPASVHLHVVRREETHTRDVVMVTPDGERTILVMGQPLHPRAHDLLPWHLFASFDAVYFTAQDPELLRRAREARWLLVAARRRESIVASGVCVDVVVGSARDPRERWHREEFGVAPRALVLTEGRDGGTVVTANGVERFAAPRGVNVTGAAYGAGDSFAGALVYYVACGREIADACAQATHHGAAVLAGSLDTLASQRALLGRNAPAPQP